MSKRIKLVAERKPPEPQDGGMTMDRIIAQMKHVKYHALTFLEGSGKAGEIDAEWKADIKACDAVTTTLTALYDGGINTPEEAQQLIAEYNSLRRKLELAGKPEYLGCGMYRCPECHTLNHFGNDFCWNCDKLLDWG